MTLKRRLKAVERNAGTDEPTVVWRNVSYESSDGEIERDVSRANLIWGNCMCGIARIGENEPREQYEARVNGYQKLTWEEAQSADGLIISKGQLKPGKVGFA